jgi:hypothetical protein
MTVEQRRGPTMVTEEFRAFVAVGDVNGLLLCVDCRGSLILPCVATCSRPR